MATRVGIELSPVACRIVEVDGGLPWRRNQGETRVRSFSVLPPSGPETRAKLESLRRKQAAVVVWGGRSEHRQVMVTAGSYESMRAEAMASLSAAGLQTTGVWADIALASTPDDRAARRPVVVAMASAAELTDTLRPLRDAGIHLRTVTTPAVALGSLARLRRAFSVPGAIEAYVALDNVVTCIALVRGGVILAARDLPWGYIDEDYAHSDPRSREDIEARLADAIGDFVAAIGGSPGDIGQVCVCGGLPGLRSMSAALMERLDVEVEPLDSLFGIDVARLPEPADEFRERGAELRLAWAVAADWPPAINLLRARRRQVSKTWLGRAAVVAGAAAGLGGSWWVVERSHLWPAPAPVMRMASNAPARGRGPAPAKPAVANRPAIVTPPPGVATRPAVVPPPPANVGRVLSDPASAGPKGPALRQAPVVVPPPPVVVKKPAVVPPPPVVVKKPAVVPPPPAVVNKPAVVPPPPVVVKKPAVVPPPPAVVNKPAVVTPPPAVLSRPAVVAPPPAVVLPPRAVERAPLVTLPPVAVVRPPVVTPPARTEPAPVRAKPAPPPEVALPFEAVLGTILFSPDRKLAIIDNRIVGIGDEVRGARVIDITPSAVMLRDEKGRLRRLALATGGR